MTHLTVVTEDSFVSLLELAANNDVKAFKRFIERDPSSVDEVGLWYGRKNGSKQMVNEQRTPLMVAATYGSIDVMKLILSLSEADVNHPCGLDQSTALHCAASGGSESAVDAVKLLLSSGADPNLMDANESRPIDVIVVSPKLQHVRVSLEELLSTDTDSSIGNRNLRISTTAISVENGQPNSPMNLKKEYPIDPSLPDIKNSIFSTDEFRMYSFKIRPCSRAYSHDWTECPFVHPGENARRRDPRKFHYSCVPCPDFRKGTCRRGDMCEYAHGVFECWLHPAQYRTRLCKDGIGCARRVCFFAHTEQELRPLYVSTGSAVPSPRSMDFAMSLLPGSPNNHFTPPMSPSANGMPVPWLPQQNVPTLHLSQSSRLRSSLNARDIQSDDFDFELLSGGPNSLNRSGRFNTLTPSNLDDLFSTESASSPRYADVFSPTHKSAISTNHMLSPINTANFGGGPSMSPRNMDPISPMAPRVSMLGQREFRSLSSRELGSTMVGSPVGPWSNKWGSSNGRPDWATGSNEFSKLRRSNSFEVSNGEEPDLSWVQSLVKESPTDVKEKVHASNGSSHTEPVDRAVLGAWFEQMQLDHFVTQQN